jgi:hypothetical protein
MGNGTGGGPSRRVTSAFPIARRSLRSFVDSWNSRSGGHVEIKSGNKYLLRKVALVGKGCLRPASAVISPQKEKTIGKPTRVVGLPKKKRFFRL